MPGNKLYRISRIVDGVRGVWSWGNIAKIKYHMSLADKYLIEAKTLFEYKQYLFAVDALKRSNNHINKLPFYVMAAEKDGKNISVLREKITESRKAHLLVLNQLKTQLPEEFTWTPEKGSSTPLSLRTIFEEAIYIRQK